MKRIIFSLALFGIACTPLVAQKHIEIKNKTDKTRIEIVSIPFVKFAKHFDTDTVFTVKNKNSGESLIHQLERLGNEEPQNVLLQVTVPAKGKIRLVVDKEKSDYPSRVFARYVPERFDDFAWENDVVAFRVYGKALEGRRDDAKGMDYWAKRTSDLIIDKWYAHGDYHRDHGDGLDYYSVGQTLGAGYLAMFFGDEIQYCKHYSAYEILDSGPIRTTFKLVYEEEDFQGHQVSIRKIISLDAGQHFNKITVYINNRNARKTPVVAGLARRGEHSPEYEFDNKRKYLAYWEPEIKTFGQTGIALLFPTSTIRFISDNPKQFLIKTMVKNGDPLTYYAGAAWNRAGKINNAKEWADHVQQYDKSLKHRLQVKLR